MHSSNQPKVGADQSSYIKLMQQLVPVPNLRRGLVCNRAEMRSWASAGRASSPLGHTISSNRDKNNKKWSEYEARKAFSNCNSSAYLTYWKSVLHNCITPRKKAIRKKSILLSVGIFKVERLDTALTTSLARDACY